MYPAAEALTSSPLAETHPQEWAEVLTFLANTIAKVIIISDVDEVLQNSVIIHLLATYKWLKKYRVSDRDMSYLEFCQAGGTNVCRYLPGYLAFNHSLRNSPEFHRNLPLMPDANQFDLLNEQVGLYLTTRPKALANLTRQILIRNNFPDRPVIARPKNKDFNGTMEWKMGVLQEIAEKLKPDQQIVMIDDNWDLHAAILELNDPRIISILFDGPVTLAQYNEAKTANQDLKSKFDALNWSQIVEKINSGDLQSLKFQNNDRHNHPTQEQ